MKMNDSFVEFVQDFITIYAKQQRDFSNNTIKSYSYALLDFIKSLKMNNIKVDSLTISEIRFTDVENFITFLKKKGNSNRTINMKMAVLKSLFSYVETKSLKNYLICSKIKNIKPLSEESKIPEYFDTTELNLIFKSASKGTHANIKYLSILVLLYDCALRANELCNLKINDLKLERSNPYLIVKNGKGNKERIVLISSNVVPIVKKYLNLVNRNGEEYLFLNRNNNKYTREGIYYVVQKYWKLAREKNSDTTLFNISPHPHMLRHSKAVNMIEAGASIIDVRDTLGHSSITTTEIYARISTKKKRQILDQNEKIKPLDIKRNKKEKMNLESYLRKITQK